MNNETRELLEQCLKALNESREDVAQAVSELPMHKADIERRRSLVLKQLENHEKCIKDIEAALAKPAQEPMSEVQALDLLPINTSMSRTDALLWVLRATERYYGIGVSA
jgi:hypothetical protein